MKASQFLPITGGLEYTASLWRGATVRQKIEFLLPFGPFNGNYETEELGQTN
jgi:hypothetical protein